MRKRFAIQGVKSVERRPICLFTGLQIRKQVRTAVRQKVPVFRLGSNTGRVKNAGRLGTGTEFGGHASVWAWLLGLWWCLFHILRSRIQNAKCADAPDADIAWGRKGLHPNHTFRLAFYGVYLLKMILKWSKQRWRKPIS